MNKELFEAIKQFCISQGISINQLYDLIGELPDSADINSRYEDIVNNEDEDEDEDDYETDEDYENYEDEDDHINGVTSRLVLGLLINDINDIAADEFAQHEYEQFKKKPSTGGGSKPQQGL